MGKIRADIGITSPHPRGYFCARTHARNSPQAALRARTRYPRACFTRGHARTAARRRQGRQRWPTRSLGAGRRWRPAEPLSLRRSHLARSAPPLSEGGSPGPHHRAERGRDCLPCPRSTATFSALDPRHHAEQTRERAGSGHPARTGAGCRLLRWGSPHHGSTPPALVGADPPWICTVGDSCHEARAHRPLPLLWI
jgi:hypothetical protein